MNIYRFEFHIAATGLACGCYIDAASPSEAWALFEATHPPKHHVVDRMSLFWDGSTNRRAWLLDHLTATQQRNVTLGNGFTAHLRVRHNWSYSSKLANEMLHLKNMQKLEQQDGTAVDTPTPYVALVFKPAKED